jgi:hypothetical protein
MKYMEHEGYSFESNGNWVRIEHDASGNHIWLSRHLLQTALDILGSED